MKSDDLIIAGLCFLISAVEWGGNLMGGSLAAQSALNFIYFIQRSVTQRRIETKGQREWWEKHRHCIQYFLNFLVSRFTARLPSYDFFSRRYGSALEINEQHINPNGCPIHYFTVQNQLLLSFIESDPLTVICRGPFGKTIWHITDQMPHKSPEQIIPPFKPEPPSQDQITEQEIPEPRDPPPPERHGQLGEWGISHLDLVPSLNWNELRNSEEKQREHFRGMFTKWLDWGRYGLYQAIGASSKYQRPRVCDFLTSIGLLDYENTLQIRPFSEEIVTPIIQAFDSLEKLPILVVPILHLLPGDTSTDYTPELWERSTPLMSEFLRGLGEPLKIDSAQFNGQQKNLRRVPSGTHHKSHQRSSRNSFIEHEGDERIPELRTTVPAISAPGGFIVFLTPAMAATEEGARAIYNFTSSSPVKVLFNESDYDVAVKEDGNKSQSVLVVKPIEIISGKERIYAVNEAKTHQKVISPFAKYQAMCASYLALGIMNQFEQVARFIYRKMVADQTRTRIDLIREIGKDKAANEFCAKTTDSFEMLE